MDQSFFGRTWFILRFSLSARFHCWHLRSDICCSSFCTRLS
jgi:hypothetical protein